jgi:hypothetical protein
MLVPMSEDAQIAESVDRHGWHAIGVEGTADEPPFVYTIGLCDRLAHPELVVVGLSPKTGHSLLADTVDRIRAGAQYRSGETIDDLIEGYRVALLPVHRTQVIRRLGYAMAYYRRASKPDLLCALQLVWPDRAGRLPQDPACVPEVARLQPLLDREVPPEELRAFLARYGSKSN